MTHRIYNYFSKPIHLVLLNGLFIAVLIILNIYYQAFCIPTTWTILVLTICFTNTILYPILKNTKLEPLTHFISGFSLFVFLYCIIFLEHMNLYGLPMILFGMGLAIYIPHFFVIQLIKNHLIKPSKKSSRYYFLSAIILCVGIIMMVGWEYKKAIISFEKFNQSNFTELDKNFMTEKILGMHFIYHTKFCEYDGWRPPKHEPILIIGMWLNNRIDPLQVDLETRLKLYKKFFPKNEYKFKCSCAIRYSQNYHKDTLWNKFNEPITN